MHVWTVLAQVLHPEFFLDQCVVTRVRLGTLGFFFLQVTSLIRNVLTRNIDARPEISYHGNPDAQSRKLLPGEADNGFASGPEYDGKFGAVITPGGHSAGPRFFPMVSLLGLRPCLQFFRKCPGASRRERRPRALTWIAAGRAVLR